MKWETKNEKKNRTGENINELSAKTGKRPRAFRGEKAAAGAEAAAAAAAGGRCRSYGRRARGGGGWFGGRVTRSPSSSPSRRCVASSPVLSATA